MDDNEFFSSVFEEVKEMLVGYFIANGINSNDVEELVNETFLLAWKYRTTLRERRKVKNWIFTIARNVLKAYKRMLIKQRRFFTNLNENISLQKGIRDDEDTSLLLDIIDKLPQMYKDVFILFYVEQRSLKEISEIIGVSENSCKVRLFRAREKIRKILEKYNET
ncbi:MAG: RNA polymerase sigma factor [Spirochaetia bacterium]|nr:RNA polymerase sigma factor [Spirochaetota bacterium]MDW8111953.1 RNA polymerase sigma factor [Spirochaetia bacterium]